MIAVGFVRIRARVGVIVVMLGAAAALLSCKGESPAVTDGLGPLPQIVVSDEPAIVLADDGTDEKLFSSVDARRLPDGSIVVADHGTTSLRLFAPDGRLRRTLARQGQGPGELSGDFVLAADGDSLFTFGQPPMAAPDVDLFTGSAGWARRFRPTTDSLPVLTVLDRVAPGRFLVHGGLAIRAIRQEPALGRLVPDTMRYGIFIVDGDDARGRVSWLPPVIRQWYFAYPLDNPRLRAALSPFPFAPTTMVRASGGRVWLVDGGTGSLRAFGGDGREIDVHALSLEPRAFDVSALDRRCARELSASGRARDSARVRAMCDPGIRPATTPLIAAAHAGADGELWLRLFDSDDAAAQRYVVVDRDGQPVARATLPSGSVVEQVGHDFVLLVRHDSVGVPSVLEHRLRRPD